MCNLRLLDDISDTSERLHRSVEVDGSLGQLPPSKVQVAAVDQHSATSCGVIDQCVGGSTEERQGRVVVACPNLECPETTEQDRPADGAESDDA